MLDFSNIEQYHENNRIEAKKALGGLPHSIWETYSAFANTLGGIILLGVEEYRDKSFHPVDLPDPEGMVEAFWKEIGRPNKVSVNILSQEHVKIEEVDGKRIVTITVPRARRWDRPVYIDGDPFRGTYLRNGEGDYRCGEEAVQQMLSDAAVKSGVRLLLESLGLRLSDFRKVCGYLTEHISGECAELAEQIGLEPERMEKFLEGLMEDEIVVSDGNNYKLKA